MGLEKCLITYIDHYNSIESIFTAPMILCAAPAHLSLSAHLKKSLIFLLSQSLPLKECHTVGLTWCVTFSDRLLSFSTMHLNFLLVLPKPNRSFIFSKNYYSIVWIHQNVFIHSSAKEPFGLSLNF